ncbi:MAG: gamma-glutamyl-gamma-aminobutyrate hydrolase family protein [Chloroflexi bacterium]|nr:gamma-glutamyl-gamma-aminobutyrate hydrolase family protein [Chloroflexota bacterium]
MQPLIGITTSSRIENGKPYNFIYARNAQVIAQAGGLPVLIPTNLGEETLRALYARLDGLLLPGGPDVHPDYYGAERHETTKEIDDNRDALELTVARWAVSDDLPVFGICRGQQVFNVALGGSLLQDIPSALGDAVTHRDQSEPRDKRLHEVAIDGASQLSQIIGATRANVNSIHHQAVGAVAPGVRVAAHSPDGVIEALEVPDRRFALTVQWHPEDLYADDPTAQQLFAAFIKSASDYAASRLRN